MVCLPLCKHEASTPWGQSERLEPCSASATCSVSTSPCRHSLGRPFLSTEFPRHGNLAGAARLRSPSFIIHLFPCNTTAAALEGHGPGTGIAPCKRTLIQPNHGKSCLKVSNYREPNKPRMQRGNLESRHPLCHWPHSLNIPSMFTFITAFEKKNLIFITILWGMELGVYYSFSR